MKSASRTYLLTGVTGFLGKVLLEELVRRKDELGIDRIGVVIRPMRGLRAPERFRRDVAESECFAQLPAHWSRIVTVLEGDIAQPGLDLAAEHDGFLRQVTHVVHAAASVRFNLPVAQAARANITASINMLELARGLPRLSRFVYVSTAYVSLDPDGTPIYEVPSPLPRPAVELYAAALDGTTSEAELLERTGHPNSYTLTKTIAEHLLMERRGNIPLTILRPSIITAAREYPIPGWLDSTAGFAAFVMLIGTGHLRALVCDPDAHLDLIPVDEVTRQIVQSSLHDTEPHIIRHAVSGVSQAPTMRQSWDVIQRFYLVNRIGRRPVRRYMGPRGARFKISELTEHKLPLALAGIRGRAMKRQAEKRGARLAYLNEGFTYFTTRTFDFRSSRPSSARYDVEAFVDTVCRGVFRHLLRRDQAEWVLAGRAHAGHDGDARWVMHQSRGNFWIRTAAWFATKLFRRSIASVTVDVPSFESARRAIPADATLVLTPSHRSYLDFVLTTYLAFARPDLLPIPHVAATMEFARIPILGRILKAMHAFYLRRGIGGAKDPDLAPRVASLLAEGSTLAFFIEGQRSRTGEFLQPKRGLLRCLQASGRTCALLPIAIAYDRVPEEDAFARERAGHPKAAMRLGGLASWVVDAWRGRIDLGRIHITCGVPVMLDGSSDVRVVSHQVIDRLRDAMGGSTVPDVAAEQLDDAFVGTPVVELKTGRKSAG